MALRDASFGLSPENPKPFNVTSPAEKTAQERKHFTISGLFK